MKKRIAFALCMILMVLMLGACGTDPTTVDYNGKSYSDLQSDMDTNAGMVQSLAQLFKENKLTADTLPDDVKDQLTSSYGVRTFDLQLNAFLGQAAIRELERLSVSKAFISAFGIDGNLVTTNHEYHSTLLLKVLEVAKKRYLLADRSKFNRSGLFRLGVRADFDRIISD